MSKRKKKELPLCTYCPGATKNPLYLEYYSHLNCMCYKVDLAHTKYRRRTLVLCMEAEGREKAERLARRAFAEEIEAALQEPIGEPHADIGMRSTESKVIS